MSWKFIINISLAMSQKNKITGNEKAISEIPLIV